MSDQLTDLQRFDKIFDHDRVKRHAGKYEYRVANVEAEMDRARTIIGKHRLNLEVYTDASLAQYRAFDIKEVSI